MRQRLEQLKQSRQKLEAVPEVPDFPRVEKLHDLQRIQEQMFPSNREVISADLDMLEGEVQELREAIADFESGRGDGAEIRREVSDVVILAMSIANYYGIDLDNSIVAKITRNIHKYNPLTRENLARRGWSREQIMEKLKGMWDRSQDERF